MCFPVTIEKGIEKAIISLLDNLHIDWKKDPNTKNTPTRVSKLFVDELLSGRFMPMPKATVFPNTKKIDELYTVGPVKVIGVCSHHFLPIIGKVWVGVIPDKKLLGLSKFGRLAKWIYARPQIQEEATHQLADLLEDLLEPKGLGVICKADHLCMNIRGVHDHDSQMTTSVMRGVLSEELTAKHEFITFVRGMKYDV